MLCVRRSPDQRKSRSCLSAAPIPLCRLLSVLLVATLLPTSLAAQHIAYDSAARTWTLTSGPVSYRLFRRDQQLAFDYFGPTSGMAATPDTAEPRTSQAREPSRSDSSVVTATCASSSPVIRCS